jgi:soluble lytic murein transglycosylase-like protein
VRRLVVLSALLAIPSMCFGATESAQTRAMIRHYAVHYNVPQELISALIDVESAWNPRAVSDKGALGLMQLMPETARHFGACDPFDPEQNIAAGTRYVTTLMQEFHGDLRLVAAAYNAGDRWVGKKQLHYRNADVIAYVESVRRHYEQRIAAHPSGGQP